MNLDTALTIVQRVLAHGEDNDFAPLSAIVLDAGGHVTAFARADGSSNLRFAIAHGKAFGAIGLGLGSRALMRRAEDQPSFIAAVNGAFGGALVPVPGGVLVRDEAGALVGAVGVTGDTSDHDEEAAIAAIEAVGLVADPG